MEIGVAVQLWACGGVAAPRFQRGHLGRALNFVWNRALREGFTFYFSKIFIASIEKIFFLQEGLSAGP